ncbi:MvdC/MvdD family ATP grasp protein [Liquorilactobacillus hordei]|uniref:Uncharacterized protein n=1 Tax=Liquorilactobacillus hordei TaxID=468911 RepID=A0A3Q8C9H5_9LACO|nr:hypothetical protein [Liquorilactobacillus hordei]AUJ29802.1 hypothetical protein BSQ49_06110 [Liquorilactobacillus hordei]
MKTILIITNSIDKTATYIQKKYASDAYFFRFNTDYFNNYSININQNKIEITDLIKKETISSLDVYSVYYRKISFPTLSEYTPYYHIFMKSEMFSLIKGIAESLGERALSRPSTITRADNKVIQLTIAKEIGFTVTNSLITNNKILAENFVKNSKENIIVKPISTGEIKKNNYKTVIQTNVVNNSNIDNLNKSPEYFQYYIEKKYEVRVTVINSKLFPVKITSNNKVDWRKINNKITYESIILPEHIKFLIFKMMAYFNLVYAAFDFIVNLKNEYYFLELNANGQWQWLEKELDLKISKEIVNYLTGG